MFPMRWDSLEYPIAAHTSDNHSYLGVTPNGCSGIESPGPCLSPGAGAGPQLSSGRQHLAASDPY
jgi:hypothetical protein